LSRESFFLRNKWVEQKLMELRSGADIDVVLGMNLPQTILLMPSTSHENILSERFGLSAFRRGQ
jgi:hypothetical protein